MPPAAHVTPARLTILVNVSLLLFFEHQTHIHVVSQRAAAARAKARVELAV